MARFASPAAGLAGILALVLAAGAAAQDRQVYRYLDADGRVVYSDRAPTGVARDVQTRRIHGNTIDTSGPSLAMQQASERYPVTLFTFECGEPCDKAVALLNRRGVPHTALNVEDPNHSMRLEQLTGENTAPVLQVGDKLIAKGFAEAQWNAMLDQAGYPRTPQRRTPPAQSSR